MQHPTNRSLRAAFREPEVIVGRTAAACVHPVAAWRCAADIVADSGIDGIHSDELRVGPQRSSRAKSVGLNRWHDDTESVGLDGTESVGLEL